MEECGMTEPYYQDEHVTLYHGDCLEVDAWLDADVLVTDPPYGIAWEQRGTYRGIKGKGPERRVRDVVKGDSDSALRQAALERWGTKPAIVFGTWKVERPAKTARVLIWDKRGSFPGPLCSAFYTTHEEIYVLGSGYRESSPPQRSVITTTELRSAAVSIGHPTPKPVQLMEVLVDRCPPGVVADPFAGSGSTLVAARNLGRRAIGVEIEERYCELIASRLAQGCLDFGEVS
jgi:DNA modification methylase